MALDELSVPGQLQELWPEFLESRRQSEEWENWALGQQTLPTIPDSSTSEFKELQKRAIGLGRVRIRPCGRRGRSTGWTPNRPACTRRL
jgi:hypothetical protein